MTVRLTPTREGVDICPAASGAKEWPHAAYSQRTGWLYTPVIDACATFTTRQDEFREGMAYWGGGAKTQEKGQSGSVKAFDAATGKQMWEWKHAHPVVSSVLATANTLMAACLADGKTVIENAACEPEVADLAHLLNRMGATIEGIGTPQLTITGVPSLKGATTTVIPDRIEEGEAQIATRLPGSHRQTRRR